MKCYFYVFSVRNNYGKEDYFITEVCRVHPFNQIIEMNKLAHENKSERFCTLISWQEITIEEFSLYNRNDKFI